VHTNPLLAGDLLVAMKPFTPAVVALDKFAGKEVWHAGSTGYTLANVVCREVAGRRQLVLPLRSYMVGLAPKTGQVLWRHAHPRKVSPTMTPAVHGDVVFFRTYGIPGYAFKVSATESGFRTQELWQNMEVHPWFNAAVAHKGRLYAINQGGKPHLVCCQMETGKIHWTHRVRGLGAYISASVHVEGDKLLVHVEDGRLILRRDAGDAFEVLGQTKVLSETTCALPAFAGGRLYARDFQHVVCLELMPKEHASETRPASAPPASRVKGAGRGKRLERAEP
jgi:outer membrane protein assembly factor BamB